MGFGDKTEERKFVYEPRDVSAIIARSRESSNTRDGFIKPNFKFFKTKDNSDHTIRQLPPTWKIENIPSTLSYMSNYIFNEKGKPSHWGIDIWVHYKIGFDKNSYLCTEKMLNTPCPICEDARASDDPDYFKALLPARRIMQWIIDRDNEKEGPLLWTPPFNTDKAILAISCDPKHNVARAIDDPEEGYDVTFHIEGIKPNIRYQAFRLSFSPCPLSTDKVKYDLWYDYIINNPLPSVLELHDYAKIKSTHEAKSNVGDTEFKQPEVRHNVDQPKESSVVHTQSKETAVETHFVQDVKVEHPNVILPSSDKKEGLTASEIARARFKKT